MMSQQRAAPPDDEPEDFHAWLADIPVDAPAFSATHRPATAVDLTATRTSPAILRSTLALAVCVGAAFGLLVAGPVTAHLLPAPARLPAASARPLIGLVPWRTPSPSTSKQYPATLDLAVATADADDAYACWLDGSAGPAGQAPLQLAATTTGGRRWHVLRAPVSHASDCHLRSDVSLPHHVLLLAPLSGAAGCQTPQVFATSDTGVHWAAVALPAELAHVCDLDLLADQGALFLWPVLRGPTIDSARVVPLWVRMGGEQAWQALGTGLPSDGAVAQLLVRADGTLLALVNRRVPAPDNGGTYEVWACTAACQRWSKLERVPGHAPTLYVPFDGSASNGQELGTSYAVDTGGSDTGVPSALFLRGQLGRWIRLPPLPSAEGTASQPLGPSGQVVGMDPAGALLVQTTATALQGGTSGALVVPVDTLWAWDPRAGQWQSRLVLEVPGSTILGTAWDPDSGDPPQVLLWLATSTGILTRTVLPSIQTPPEAPISRCRACH